MAFFVLPSLTLTNVFDDRTGTPSSGLRRQADLCRRYHPDSRCRSHCPISTVGVNYEGMIIPRYMQHLLSCREYIRLSMWSFQWRLHFLRLGQTLNCIIWVFEMNNWAVAWFEGRFVQHSVVLLTYLAGCLFTQFGVLLKIGSPSLRWGLEVAEIWCVGWTTVQFSEWHHLYDYLISTIRSLGAVRLSGDL